jgi:archaellum component FlaG (FlaF/FlaG flagellin family)
MNIATIAIILVAVFFAGVLVYTTKKLAEQ